MASKVISRLSILLGVSSDKLKAELGRAAGSVKDFGGKARQAGGGLKHLDDMRARAGAGMNSLTGRFRSAATGLLGFVAASAAATLSIRGLTSSFGELDKLAKTADKLGDTTEALAGFLHAAELSGVTTQQAAIGLQRMVRRISDAAQGTGDAKKAIEELGLSAERLSKMTPTQAFAEIAEAMQKVENQGDRVRLTFKLFDSEGVNLVNTMAAGKRGLAEAAREAKNLGLAVDRDMARKAEIANDAITRMNAAAKGMTQQLAIKLAPALVSIAEAMTKLLQQIQRLDADTVKTAVQIGAMAVAFGTAVAIVPRLVAGLVAVIKTLRALTTASILAQGATGIGLAKLAVGLAAAGGAALLVDRQFKQLTGGANKAAQALKKAGHDGSQAMNGLKKSTNDAQKELEKWERIGQSITERFKTPLEKVTEEVEQARRALNKGAISVETYRRAMAHAAKQLVDLKKKNDDLKRSVATGVGVAAAVRGTTAGVEAAHRGRNALQAQHQQLKELKKTAEEQKRLQKEAVKTLQAIEDKIDREPITVVAHKIN
tara:strand:- start:1929 stop:3563 length:1635 start_codon:yes stop_codon:yes gene_type:complete